MCPRFEVCPDHRVFTPQRAPRVPVVSTVTSKSSAPKCVQALNCIWGRKFWPGHRVCSGSRRVNSPPSLFREQCVFWLPSVTRPSRLSRDSKCFKALKSAFMPLSVFGEQPTSAGSQACPVPQVRANHQVSPDLRVSRTPNPSRPSQLCEL